MKFFLSACPPFSLKSVVKSHGWASLAPYSIDSHLDGLTYVYRMDSGQVVEILIQEGSDGVSIEVDGQLNEAECDEVTRKVEYMLGLEQNFNDFYRLARDEPKLANIEKQAQGRLLRCPTLFEDVVKTILTTNTMWAGTIRMVEKLVSQFGDPLSADPSRHAFPTAEQLAATHEESLRSTVRLGYRAPYVLELARDVASGTLDLESLKTADIPSIQLHKRLLAIKGVGGYAAANLLMILGRYDFVPIDSWALKMVSHEWYRGEPVGRAEVEAAFEQWGEWKGLAYWFWDWSHVGED